MTTTTPIAQETIDILKKLQLSLNHAEDIGILKGDQASDFFSDLLDSIGKDYEWWSEL